MGQTPSNPTIATPSITRYSPKYHVIETKQDPHYGEVKIIVEDETKELQILKEISFSSQAAFDKELDYFTQRVQVSHPNIASILGFSSEVDNNAFPQSFTIKIFIEMLDKDLRQEHQERIQAHKFLSESELLFICENIISALYHLETKGFSHGDIRPFNIFVSPKGYKLFDPSLSSLRNHSGIVNAIKHGLQVFLSPELLDQVPERKTEVTCNKFKADVFSLGVTLLSLASLTHGEDLYNYETGRIDKMLLRQRLDVVKNRYSAFTHDLIKDMLTEEESDRPNFKALHTKLLPYQDNIHQKTDLPFFKNKGLRKGEEAIIDPQSGHQVEYTRKPTGSGSEEHEKPGGIIVNPEDVIPSKRDDLHKVFSERTHEVYYYQMLHPRTQGTTGNVLESEANRGQEKPLKSQMQTQEKMEGPVREFDYQKTRVFEEKENVKMGGSHKDAQDILLTKEEKERIEKEHFRNQQREPIRTGSILINEEDVLPSMKESLHTLPRTGETYANLISSTQIREQGGIVHAGAPHERELRTGATQTKREPIRTGSILINEEDVLPAMRESLHTYPRTGETYANLTSSTQIAERGGIVHGEPWTGVKEVDMQKAGPDTVQEPIKTGGILIHMFDVMPQMTESVFVDPHSGETFAQLKSGSQIREEQRGIVHAGMPQERELRTAAMHRTEPIRSGSILINEEDVLPSMKESLHTLPRTGETYANLISSTQIREQGGNIHAGMPHERELRAGAMQNREPIRSGSILINPEDVLPSMRENVHTDYRTGATYANLTSSTQIGERGGIIHTGGPQERELRTGATQTKREPIRTGSILINEEDVLPAMRESLHTYPRTGETYANLISDSQIRAQGGIVHAGGQERELKTGMVETKREPIRTGSILINEEDVLPAMRESLHTYPRTGETYANLISDSQIRAQGGIVHARAPQERELRAGRKESKREPIRTGSILINEEDVLPAMRESLHTYPRTGETYANLTSSSQIAERGGIVHGGGEQAKSSLSRDMGASRTFSRQFSFEHTRESAQADPIKTGGIIIRVVDAVAHMKNNIHRDPRSGVTYAMLKPWSQIKEEQAGITHYHGEVEEEKTSAMPVFEARIEDRPVQEIDPNAFRTRSRMFNLERERIIGEEDPIKTGGIVIHPDDVLPMHRLDVRTIPRSGLSYVNLKPWMKIQKEQAGIIHQVPLQEAREKHELKKFSKKRSSIIEGESMISSKRREVELRGSSASLQKEAFRSRNRLMPELTIERIPEFVSSRPETVEFIRTAQPTRFIEPENMLAWVKKEPEAQVPGEEQEPRHHREPIKTGSILIHAEDVLPSQMDKLHTDPHTGETYAMLKSDAQIREQGGIVHARPEREGQEIEMSREARVPEEKKAVSSIDSRVVSRYFCYEYEPRNTRGQEEPIKTGGILIHPYDAWPSFRESIVEDPRSHLTYVLLKPWKKIQKEQNGVIHSSSIHHHVSSKKDRKEQRRVSGQKEVEYQYSRENTNELMKRNEIRQENVISYDKENISNLMNFQKKSIPQGEFSKSSAVPLGEISENVENVDQNSGFFKKQAEDQSKWLRLNDKVDNMLRKSRVILGESHLNNSQNIL